MGKPKLTAKQREFLQNFDDLSCNISMACKATGIKSRQTFYNWMDNQAFYEKVEEAREGLKDYVESKIIQNIKDGKETTTIFFAKTQMKDRGYVEKTELEVDHGISGDSMKGIADLAEKFMQAFGK